MDQRARTWVESAMGPGARVVRNRKLTGGISSDMRTVDVDRGDGERRRLVLRRHTNLDWLEREPDLVAREAKALELLASAGVPTPELVAFDTDGFACGEPAVLMTRLPGTHHWDPPSIERLAGGGQQIPSIEAPRGVRQEPRYPGVRGGPAWGKDPKP